MFKICIFLTTVITTTYLTDFHQSEFKVDPNEQMPSIRIPIAQLSVSGKQTTEEDGEPQSTEIKTRECKKGWTFRYGVIPVFYYTEEPEVDPSEESGYTCCYYINGEPECPNPPEEVNRTS